MLNRVPTPSFPNEEDKTEWLALAKYAADASPRVSKILLTETRNVPEAGQGLVHDIVYTPVQTRDLIAVAQGATQWPRQTELDQMAGSGNL